VQLNPDDPYLRHNLNRLEERFRIRYFSSVQRDKKRQKGGKKSHQTTLKSIKENKRRFEEVRRLKHELLGDTLDIRIKKSVKK
jgi:hypothetical protein